MDSSISLPKRSSSNYPATLFYRNTDASDLTAEAEVAVAGGVIRLMRNHYSCVSFVWASGLSFWGWASKAGGVALVNTMIMSKS